ncbi:hypothetical protein LINPERHAP1_LOCUS6636 [Linum perenne]
MYSSGAEEVSAIDVHKAKSLIESGHVYLMSGIPYSLFISQHFLRLQLLKMLKSSCRMEEDFWAAHARADMIWKQGAHSL